MCCSGFNSRVFLHLTNIERVFYNLRMRNVASIDRKSAKYQAYLRELKPYQRQIWDIMLQTGLRISDAVSLTYGACVRGLVSEKKTGHRRRIVYTPPPKPAGQLSDYVCPNPKTDRPYNRSTLSRAYTAASRAARLPAPLCSHSARKMYALALLERTHDLTAVQRDLGHNYLSTTLLYLFGHPHITQRGEVKTYGS